VLNIRSSLDTRVFFESFELAGKTLGNKSKALANDSHFSEVVLARLEGKVYRVADDDQYQVWDGKACQWTIGKAQDVYAIVKKELVAIWAPKHVAGPGEVTRFYPVPLVETSFINRIKDIFKKLIIQYVGSYRNSIIKKKHLFSTGSSCEDHLSRPLQRSGRFMPLQAPLPFWWQAACHGV